MKAFYYGKKGSNESKGSPEGRVFLKQASEAYLAAAECFPQDDETHACKFLRFDELTITDVPPRVLKLRYPADARVRG